MVLVILAVTLSIYGDTPLDTSMLLFVKGVTRLNPTWVFSWYEVLEMVRLFYDLFWAMCDHARCGNQIKAYNMLDGLLAYAISRWYQCSRWSRCVFQTVGCEVVNENLQMIDCDLQWSFAQTMRVVTIGHKLFDDLPHPVFCLRKRLTMVSVEWGAPSSRLVNVCHPAANSHCRCVICNCFAGVGGSPC